MGKGKSIKIIIGVVAAVVVVWGGYALLNASNGNAPESTGNNPSQNISQGNVFQEHFQRAMEHLGS